jgi:hypothetical protein
MFYGAGIVVFPVVLIYTVAVYWIFRGKVHDSLALSRQASTGHDVRAQLSRQ